MGARAATAAASHARNVKSRAKKRKLARTQTAVAEDQAKITRAKPGIDTTTVQRGLSGATVAEAKCAMPGTCMVEEAKVTGPGPPNATSVVTETVVQSTAVAEIAVEAEARATEHLAAAVAETATEAGTRRAEQLASAVSETEAEA